MNFKQYIAGEWVDALNGKTWDVTDPATEEPIQTVPFGNADDARRALEAAQAAQPAWAALTAYERAAILPKAAAIIRARVEEFAPYTVRESGKPIAEARGEWLSSANLLEWFAEEGKRVYGRTIPARMKDKRLLVVYMPVGVIVTITAWNFPVWLLARAWGASLAAGCAVVGRPSELTPLSAMLLTEVLVEAGLPPGVLNLVNGEPAPMGEEFLRNPICRKISFTGSTRTGKLLMRGAAENVTRLSLELGGSAPVLVFPDANLDWAAKQSVAQKFRNNGQVCVSPQRFYVHHEVQEQFIDRVQDLVSKMKMGHGLEQGVSVGPLISATQRDKVEALVNDAVGHGAMVVTGGSRPADRSKGYFFTPTILTGLTPEMRITNEEIFGPVMPIVPFHTTDEALKLANSTEYGLAAYVMTNDLKTAIRMYEGLEFGIIGVNDMAPTSTEGPFGGMKQSGLEREQGSEGLMKYLETKFVSIGL
jgi:succinate-semialdehyde dehydrogenase